MPVESIGNPVNPILQHLDDQISWYDRRSLQNKRLNTLAKSGILISALIIVLAGEVEGSRLSLFVGFLATLIVLLQSIDQLQQYQVNSISYRSTAESLKHEKYLYLGKAGPYSNVDNPNALLTERVENLISREHSAWASQPTGAAMARAVQSSKDERELRAATQIISPDISIPPELIARIFKSLQVGKLSGWELARSAQEDPKVVSNALNFLKAQGLIDSTGPGLEGYYYLTSAGFIARDLSRSSQ